MPKIINLLPAILLLFPAICFAELPTVTVQGAAELKFPADRANFVLSVVSRDRIPRTAMQENSARLEKVLDAVQRAGLVDREISTGRFVVSPVWSQRPRQAPTDWKSEIIGYTVTNTLRVKTAKIDQVGEFIAAAVKAGSNEVKGLHFDLLDRRQHRQEAIRIATERASEDARVLAVAGGAKLGRVISLNLDNARANPKPVMMNRALRVESAMSPPVMPGEVTVRANVTAVFEITTD